MPVFTRRPSSAAFRSEPDDRDARGVRVETHLLGRFSQRRCRRIGVSGSALPPGKLTSPL